MDYKEYLKSILPNEELKELNSAIKKGKLIIVTGEQGSTGKSTLTEILRKKGIDAIEGYQVHIVVLNNPIDDITPDIIHKLDF